MLLAAVLLLAFVLWPRPLTGGVDWGEVSSISISWRTITSTMKQNRPVPGFESCEFRVRPEDEAAWAAVQTALAPARWFFTPGTLVGLVEGLLTGGLTLDKPGGDFWLIFDPKSPPDERRAVSIQLFEDGRCIVGGLVCAVSGRPYEALAALAEAGTLPPMGTVTERPQSG
ncbi:MAG: hypothetical protein IJF59_06405 [Clostridia bacterium]|nr:hypothetical protein [Clostridia bacterium]